MEKIIFLLGDLSGQTFFTSLLISPSSSEDEDFLPEILCWQMPFSLEAAARVVSVKGIIA